MAVVYVEAEFLGGGGFYRFPKIINERRLPYNQTQNV